MITAPIILDFFVLTVSKFSLKNSGKVFLKKSDKEVLTFAVSIKIYIPFRNKMPAREFLKFINIRTDFYL